MEHDTDSATGSRIEKVRALVLAAGEGTRLRPWTERLAKPMVPVGGRPLLAWTLEHLAVYGVTEIAVNLHHRPESITAFFGEGNPRYRLTYSYEERLLGSAGAAKRLEWFFPSTFLIVYGDVLSDFDVADLLAAHRARGAVVTVGVHAVPDPSEKGVVVADADGRIRQFIEKPGRTLAYGNRVNAGFCVLEPAVLRYVEPDTPSDLGRDLFPALLAAGERLYAADIKGYVRDLGNPEDYAAAQADFAAGRVRPGRVSG